MNKIIGFIGTGNMAKAIIGGILTAGLAEKTQIICSNNTSDKLEEAKKTYGIMTTLDNEEVAKKADILFLSVKPQVYKYIIDEIKGVISNNTIIVAIAAGKTTEEVKEMFGKEIKLIRVMPNTPALVGEGMAAIYPCPEIQSDELELVCKIFNSFGKSEIVTEGLMDVVTGLSGSSPAFIFMIIEAMADGAVLEGMPRSQAYKFAAQTVLGSAKMVLETGKHPGELKDMVCSPAGTTIEGVAELEQCGIRSSIINAVKAATEKSKNMSK